MRSDFLNLEFEVEELATAVADALGRRYTLVPLGVRCTFPVFRGDAPDAPSVFVKIGTREEWVQTHALLEAVVDCGLFAKFLVDCPVEFHGCVLFVMEWREGVTIRPESMTDRQLEGFVIGCRKLSTALQKAQGIVVDNVAKSPERMFGTLADYVRRHPVAGKLLKGLASIPAEQRTYGERKLSVLHGDFHAKNFAFNGDELACVYDFDKLSRGLACGDFANALVERFSCLSLSGETRRRLAVAARKLIGRSPWPRDELRIMVNVGRLRFASHRIEKHPDSAWVALDILRRDLKIRELLACGLED